VTMMEYYRDMAEAKLTEVHVKYAEVRQLERELNQPNMTDEFYDSKRGDLRECEGRISNLLYMATHYARASRIAWNSGNGYGDQMVHVVMEHGE